MTRELWNVWSVDPGGYTGVVSVVLPFRDELVDGDPVELLAKSRAKGMTFAAEIQHTRWQEHVEQIVKGVIKGRQWVAEKAAKAGYDGSSSVMICEGFVGTGEVMKSDQFSPVLIRGCLEWGLEERVREFCAPLPAAKAQITDARLKQWGWYRPGKPHYNDAMRHLFVWLRSRHA